MVALIAITGMPGAGKTFVAEEIARALDCEIITMGDVIREEVESLSRS